VASYDKRVGSIAQICFGGIPMKPLHLSGQSVLACFIIAAGTATVAVGQNGQDASMGDKHFVSEALKGGQAEVQMGKLAEQQGNSSDVKSFGRRMVQDHTKMGEQMKGVAGEEGITPPTSPTILQQAEIKKLKGLSGDAFDQEYIKTMVKDHETDLNDFKKESQDGKSAKVKDAASQGASVISEHLTMIRQIAQAHGIAAK
jgi:putative membrane protein